MRQPEGYTISSKQNKVYRLVKPLFVKLSKLLTIWHEKLENLLGSSNFQINDCDEF